jgi:hypothetical protein
MLGHFPSLCVFVLGIIAPLGGYNQWFEVLGVESCRGKCSFACAELSDTADGSRHSSSPCLRSAVLWCVGACFFPFKVCAFCKFRTWVKHAKRPGFEQCMLPASAPPVLWQPYPALSNSAHLLLLCVLCRRGTCGTFSA